MRPKHIEARATVLANYEKLIHQYIDYWIPVLGLDNWSRIDISCHIDSHPVNSDILGSTSSDWRYMEGDVAFYLGAIAACEADEERLEYIVVHELCHIVVCEMRTFEDSRQEISDKVQAPHEERVVSNMAMALLRTKQLQAKKKPAAKAVKKGSKK